MSRLAALFSACVLAIAWAGSAQAQSAKAEIEAVIGEFEAAFNGKDAAAVAELYAADAAIFPPESPRIDGKEGIGNYWRGGIDAGLSDLDLSAVEIEDSGNTAHEVGTFSLKAPVEGGGSSDIKGQYIVIWKKNGEGKWRLYRDIWNTGPTQN